MVSQRYMAVGTSRTAEHGAALQLNMGPHDMTTARTWRCHMLLTTTETDFDTAVRRKTVP